MVDEQQAKIVEDIINSENGIKATELATKVAIVVDDLPEILNYLMQAKRIVEVEFVLPHMEYRVKSFLLPKNTNVRIRCGL